MYVPGFQPAIHKQNITLILIKTIWQLVLKLKLTINYIQLYLIKINTYF